MIPYILTVWIAEVDCQGENNSVLRGADGDDTMRLKWFGTATILLEQNGTQLLFDPFFPLNDKSFKPLIDDLAAVENILVTHGHLDHIADIPAVLMHGGGRATVWCTKTPRETLISKGVGSERIQVIKPGDCLYFPPFEIRVLKGKHIVFDMRRIIQTFFSPRIFKYRKNLKKMLSENRINTESGETVVYDITVQGERILLMGSLNLDDDVEYPAGADLLILPFQGRSDIAEYSMRFVERLKPKKVLLDHFDDTFPPVSSQVKTERFLANMQRIFPAVPVICQPAGIEWIIPNDK